MYSLLSCWFLLRDAFNNACHLEYERIECPAHVLSVLRRHGDDDGEAAFAFDEDEAEAVAGDAGLELQGEVHAPLLTR